MRDIFLCRTPLQAVYVETIIKKNGKESDVVFLKPVNSSFQDYAIYNLTKLEKVSNIYVFNLFTRKNKFLGLLEHLYVIFSILIRFYGKSYDSVYIASIDCLPFQILLNYLKVIKIFTYDDGSANINKKSSYYKSDDYSLPMRIISSIFLNKTTKKTIVNQSLKHYTMFKGENIIRNTECIFDDIVLTRHNNKDVRKEGKVVVFLGTVFSDLKLYTTSMASKIEFHYHYVDFYYPHPRDNEKIFTSKRVDDFRISELKLLDLRTCYDHVHVIGFPSSTILHLKDSDGFTFDVFYLEGISFDYSILSSHNISIIELPFIDEA